MEYEKIIVIDFGVDGQEIARKVRAQKVYCEVLPSGTKIGKIKSDNLKGIILAHKPSDYSLTDFDFKVFDLDVPVLCLNGEEILKSQQDYKLINLKKDSILKGINKKLVVNSVGLENKNIYGIELIGDLNTVITNFLFNVCKISANWTAAKFAQTQIAQLKQIIGDKKVLCALSGGVDSAVAAALVHRAVGNQLTCVFVDHGLMRYKEADEVVSVFRDTLKMNLIKVDAKERFLEKLKGVAEPEQKRKIIGEEFIRVFEEQSKKIGKVPFLIQGTIYPDIIESGAQGAKLIKSHHNVGGLPSVVDFDEIIEPLKQLFKDEVRSVGLELGLSSSIVNRQPFPGPGLGIRIIGDITSEKVDILQRADKIYRDEIAANKLDQKIWQYFAVLTSMRTVGVTDKMRTYSYTLALRAVNSVDGMSAAWAKIDLEILERISARITELVPEINRIVYDITSKPPATIEWE